jgi:hypothetical protein
MWRVLLGEGALNLARLRRADQTPQAYCATTFSDPERNLLLCWNARDRLHDAAQPHVPHRHAICPHARRRRAHARSQRSLQGQLAEAEPELGRLNRSCRRTPRGAQSGAQSGAVLLQQDLRRRRARAHFAACDHPREGGVAA